MERLDNFTHATLAKGHNGTVRRTRERVRGNIGHRGVGGGRAGLGHVRGLLRRQSHVIEGNRPHFLQSIFDITIIQLKSIS